MTAAIETKGVSKRFGRIRALQPLDLVVEPGVVYGYLGPNGAGKTTTLRILAGLLKPSEGSASICGVDVWRQRDRAHRRLGYLPGDFVATADATSRHYLCHLLALRGVDSVTAIDKVADRLGLDLDRRIGSLSHGNRQKIGLVQALMHDPDVLILDEPSAGLDPLVQRTFLDILRERRASGCAILLSSHILSEVEAIANRVGFLRDGRLIDDRKVEDLQAAAPRRLDFRFDRAPDVAVLRRVPGVRSVNGTGESIQVVASGSLSELMATVAPFGIQGVVTHDADLEDLFITYYGEK